MKIGSQLSAHSDLPGPRASHEANANSIVAAPGVGRTAWGVARWADRLLLSALALFAISVPHSIAAAQTTLSLGLLCWIVRDLALRRFHWRRTPIDLPLLCFGALTVLSAFFSVEPQLSLPKLKALVLFALIYLLAANVSARGVRWLAALVICSGLVGVGFSLVEKVVGRGMVVAAIDEDSPVANSNLRPGDVVWMIARRRVASLEAAAHAIRTQRTGAIVDIEALHEGDPIPVTITVTDELKARVNPLGIASLGPSRQFRVSGFSRQFLTYAEQMQMLGLFVFGAVLACARVWRRPFGRRWLVLAAVLFWLFAAALTLTASRSVLASFVIALIFTAISAGGRRAPLLALAAALVLGSLSFYTLTSSRQQGTINFDDDSAARRIAYMQAGLRLIPRHPLLGVGMDAHKRHWREWSFPGDYITHTHSTPIQLALDRGLPALACYVWMIVMMLVAARRGLKDARARQDAWAESLALGTFGAVLGFSLSSLTNYNFGDSEALMLLLFLFGLLAAQRATQQV